MPDENSHIDRPAGAVEFANEALLNVMQGFRRQQGVTQIQFKPGAQKDLHFNTDANGKSATNGFLHRPVDQLYVISAYQVAAHPPETLFLEQRPRQLGGFHI